MSNLPEVGDLVGSRVRLEALAERHVDGLVAAAAGSRDTFGFATVPRGRDGTVSYVRNLLAVRDRGEDIPFAQISIAHDQAVGCTRFGNLRIRPGERTPYAVEIGGTWLAGFAQRTGINSEAKLLLLTHAFDVWHVGRVDIKTDARNSRARIAISALGATFEGILRNWQPSQVPGQEDLLRDTAMYSVVDAQWPAVRQSLRARRG